MPNNRQIRNNIRNLKRVKTWQLVIVLILMAFVTATFYRINNVGMLQRRDAVLSADKSGQVDDIRARLYDLQRYSSTHMNAGTGLFYLQGQYDRDTQKVLDQINAIEGGQTVNARAEAVCKPQFTSYSPAYTQCMLNEITRENQVADPLQLPKTPDPDLYRYEFVSPALSPDFAGLSTIITVFILFVITTRGISLAVLKLLLKRHYRGI